MKVRSRRVQVWSLILVLMTLLLTISIVWESRQESWGIIAEAGTGNAVALSRGMTLRLYGISDYEKESCFEGKERISTDTCSDGIISITETYAPDGSVTSLLVCGQNYGVSDLPIRIKGVSYVIKVKVSATDGSGVFAVDFRNLSPCITFNRPIELPKVEYPCGTIFKVTPAMLGVKTIEEINCDTNVCEIKGKNSISVATVGFCKITFKGTKEDGTEYVVSLPVEGTKKTERKYCDMQVGTVYKIPVDKTFTVKLDGGLLEAGSTEQNDTMVVFYDGTALYIKPLEAMKNNASLVLSDIKSDSYIYVTAEGVKDESIKGYNVCAYPTKETNPNFISTVQLEGDVQSVSTTVQGLSVTYNGRAVEIHPLKEKVVNFKGGIVEAYYKTNTGGTQMAQINVAVETLPIYSLTTNTICNIANSEIVSMAISTNTPYISGATVIKIVHTGNAFVIKGLSEGSASVVVKYKNGNVYKMPVRVAKSISDITSNGTIEYTEAGRIGTIASANMTISKTTNTQTGAVQITYSAKNPNRAFSFVVPFYDKKTGAFLYSLYYKSRA